MPVKSAPCLHQQISEFLRAQIIEGGLPVGSLVPTGELVREWETSYFTIQRALAPLVREGLIRSRRKFGTQVVASRPRLASAGMYYGADVWNIPQAGFYRVLNRALQRRLQQRRVSMKVVVDQRGESLQGRPPSDLPQMIHDREIQALVVPIANLAEMGWLERLPIPMAYLGTADVPWRVLTDFRQSLSLAMARLKAQGVRGVGLIAGSPLQPSMRHPYNQIYANFVELIGEMGLFTRNAWCAIPKDLLKSESMEEFGYRAFLDIWEAPKRPEGLICLSDTIGRGVFSAVLEKQIRVPADLKIIQHKNRQIGFFSPVAADWLVADAEKYADALLRQIDIQFADREPEEILIPAELELSSPTHP